jgi:glyoxylase-like metal-dependent hydrolase (beta-lactamase superfamily II)/rhodanese-related sulfurtransferase
MYIEQFFVDGLGCASYLIGCEGKGIAAVVDPDRDVQKYIDAARTRGMSITHIIETHLHADHVSGNTDLAARTGADIYLHEAAGAEFPHRPIKDGDTLQLGAVKIHVRHTPGHTPESVTLLISDTTRAETPWMALTGDLLFVGDIGRPDLVGVEAARGLAGHLYDSLFHNLLKESDHLMLYPGHGAGSLCGRSIGAVRSTTLGFEKQFNPALEARNKEDFVEYMTSNLPEQPGNHRRIKAANRQGPRPLGEITPRPLPLMQALPYFRQGAALLDTRPKANYVEKHVPGSVNLPIDDDQFSNRVGFVLPAGAPIILLADQEEDYRKAVLALARVGYEDVIGYLEDGLSGWEAMGLPVTSGDVEDVQAKALSTLLQDDAPPVVLDVREPWEYESGHLPGAVLIPLGQLSQRFSELDPERPVAVICQSGSRSQSAAMLLAQKGFGKIYNVMGGMNAWERHGLPVTREMAETARTR